MDLVCAFVELCPDAVYDTIPALDIHALACTHRTVQAVVDRRMELRDMCAHAKRRRPPHAVIQRAHANIQRALEAVQHGSHLACAQNGRKAAFRRFLELSKRRSIPRSVTFPKETGGTHVLYEIIMRPEYVCFVIKVMGLWIDITDRKGRSSAYISTAIFDHSNMPLDPSWNESLALGVAIVTHYFGVSIETIQPCPLVPWEDEDVVALLKSVSTF